MHTKEDIKRDLIVNGDIFKVILIVAGPMMFMNIMTYSYNIIDSILIADIGAMEASAVAITNQIKGVMQAVSTGFSIPCTILIARLIGKNDIGAAKKLSHLLIVLAAIIGIIISLIGIFGAQTIMQISNVPESLISIAKIYFTIQIVTVGVSVFNSVYLSFEKARGATINIFYINLVQILIKITLTVLFVKVFNFGINMVAVATLISTVSISLFCLIRLSNKNYVFRFSKKNFEFDKKSVVAVRNLAIPIFSGKFIFSAGKVITNSIAVSLGDTTVGALSISNNINASTTTVTESMEEVLSVIISQNLGAGKKKRALKVFYIVLFLNVIISIIGFSLCSLYLEHIVRLFAQTDIEFYEKIYTCVYYERFGVLPLGINSAVMGLLYGFGYTKASYILNISRLFLFRIPILFYFVNFTSIGIEGAAIAVMISNIAVGVISLILGIMLVIRIYKYDEVKEII